MATVTECDVDATPDARSDGELLAGVAAGGSAECFEQLVQRHSAMVLGACQRQLGDASDAEDAAQAVFLVLWKKVASLRRRKSVAGWLHHVARNVCRNARRAQQVRKKHEQEAAQMNPVSQTAKVPWDDIKEVLDEELDRLPEKYRLPIILFHLEGRSQEEIAALLNTKPATVATRLKRARERLRSRLARRGITIGAGALVGSLTANACAAGAPAAFITTTSQATALSAAGQLAAGGAASAQASALAQGAINMLTIAKIKMAAVMLATTAAVSTTGVVVVQSIAQAEPEAVAADDIAWGEAKDGVRLGLAPAKLEIAAEAASFEIDVWYENVGEQPRVVPVHKVKEGADGSLISLEGRYDEDILKFRFPFRLPEPSRATALPESKTLPAGERFKERFRLHFADGEVPKGIDFWALPALAPGKSMRLQVVYPQVLNPAAKFDAAVERKSGSITVTRKVGKKDDDISWGEAKDGVRLGLSPKKLDWSRAIPNIDVELWYENVGSEPCTVPQHHLKFDANLSHVMFTGEAGGKPFELKYLALRRRGTQSPKDVSLKPGEQFHETFRIHSPPDAVIHRLQFGGLPALEVGKSLTLRACWLPGKEIAIEGGKAPRDIIISGDITVTLVDLGNNNGAAKTPGTVFGFGTGTSEKLSAWDVRLTDDGQLTHSHAFEGLAEESEPIEIGKEDNDTLWRLIRALEIHRVPGNELAPSEAGDIAFSFSLESDGKSFGHHIWRSDAMKVEGYRKLVETLGDVLKKHTESEHVWFASPADEPADKSEKELKVEARVDGAEWNTAFEKRVARIQPTADERRWMEIPWVRTAAEAAEQAKAEDRLIFIFSVSGKDPLGRC